MSEPVDDAHPTTVEEHAADASVGLAEAIVAHLASRERSWRRIASLTEQLAWITGWAARQERRP